MGTKLQARILHTLARNDCFDGVGRIFLLDAREATRNPDLASSDITDLWQEYYPQETADEKQFNLVLIYFDGKATTQNIRSARTPIIPERQPPTVDGQESFSASTPDSFEPADYKAENPEDRIIL